MIIIDVAQAVEAARRLRIDVTAEVAAIESAMTGIGEALAAYLGVALVCADIQSPDFAGACLSFGARRRGQRCPHALRALDPGGELEVVALPRKKGKADAKTG